MLPILGLVLVACAPSVNSIARQASRAAVDEGSEALTRQDTQESLHEAAQNPEIQAATTAMTEQIGQGILKSLESDQAHDQLAALTRMVTKNAVQQMVAEMGSQQTRAQLVGLTSAVADAALKQAAASMRSEFRPVIREIIQQDIAQGMAHALKNDLQPELGATAQNVAYHAVMGANSGLGAAWLGSDGMMGEARSMSLAGPSRAWLWGGLAMMGLLTLMFLSVAAMMIARARRTRAEVSRLESATLLLATAMREKQETEKTDEIVAIVQQALAGRAEHSGRHRILGALKMRKAG
jgi:hypothetical protein